MGLFIVAVKTLVHDQRRLTRQQGYAVMTFLPMEMHVITQRFDFGLWELIVRDLGFLQADDVRLVFFNQRRQLMRARAQAVDVERHNFHRRQSWQKSNRDAS